MQQQRSKYSKSELSVEVFLIIDRVHVQLILTGSTSSSQPYYSYFNKHFYRCLSLRAVAHNGSLLLTSKTSNKPLYIDKRQLRIDKDNSLQKNHHRLSFRSFLI
ncbi:unnamed protein product [Amoebophrya sp. A25]|nr:unnamed protein product [Amoebophrya sp. A25]|eukprot:GSA25T00027396001.1